jgi:hypothetical protein
VFDRVFWINQWTQFVPIGDALIRIASQEVTTIAKLMKVPAADGPHAVCVRSALISAQALNYLDDKSDVLWATTDDDAAGARFQN